MGGKKKCALNINEKCLKKEIVTNKKQRLFITKGAMESPIYHLQGVLSKNLL